MLPSNLTLDELIRMGAVPEALLPIIERWQQDQQSVIDDAVEKETEHLREQIYFAQNLLEELETAIDRETKMAEFKKTFRRLLDDTSFER
jgi:hypothetical protein